MPVHTTAFGAIETVELGDGDETVVLVHGSASAPRALVPLGERLAAKGRRIILPALSGYGATLIDPKFDLITANAEIIRFALTQARGRRILIGHSMGGLIAMKAVAGGAAADVMIACEPVAFGVLAGSTGAEAEAAAWDAGVAATLLENLAAGEPEAGVRGFVEAWNEMPWAYLPPSAREALVAAADVIGRDVAAVSRGPDDGRRLCRRSVVPRPSADGRPVAASRRLYRATTVGRASTGAAPRDPQRRAYGTRVPT